MILYAGSIAGQGDEEMGSVVEFLARTLKGRGMANLLRRAGFVVSPLANSTGRLIGARLQWEEDEPDAVRGTIVSFTDRGQRLHFFIENDLDEVQGRHRRGGFYEVEELDIISRHFRGGTFVDVGANVGNHALFVLKFLDASKVIAFEPLASAFRLLELNLLLNDCQHKVERHRVGLSDKAGSAAVSMDGRAKDNLGATQLVEAAGPLKLCVGDDVLGDQKVDFIKIDTEGFEMKVLAGLRKTIERDRPTLFVEVAIDNQPAFDALIKELNYEVPTTHKRYAENLNNLAVPR